MTEEQKAKKYDEALGWMRKVYPTLTGADKEDAEHYFPELKESEDERIRKEILEDIRNVKAISSEEYRKKADRWIAWLEKQKEQKPAEWSEEDEIGLEETMWCVNEAVQNAKTESEKQNAKTAENWLKSLRPQPKQEWSEEDEEMFDEALAGVLLARNRMNDTGCIGLAERFEKAYKWLESFRPRPHWKPSKEQMRALWEIYQGGEAQAPIASLYEDLKKL